MRINDKLNFGELGKNPSPRWDFPSSPKFNLSFISYFNFKMRIISKNEMRRVKNKGKLARIENEKLENFGLSFIHSQTARQRL